MKHGTGTLWTLNPFPGDVPCGGERGGVLKDFGLQEAKGVTTPMEAGEETEPWKLVQGMEPTHTK